MNSYDYALQNGPNFVDLDGRMFSPAAGYKDCKPKKSKICTEPYIGDLSPWAFLIFVVPLALEGGPVAYAIYKKLATNLRAIAWLMEHDKGFGRCMFDELGSGVSGGILSWHVSVGLSRLVWAIAKCFYHLAPGIE